MREADEHRDPERDAETARLLRAAGDASAVPTAAEWDAMRARLATAAESRLAERVERRRAWWSPLARWTRPALPLGVAACVALAVLVVAVESPPTTGNADSVALSTSPGAESLSAFLGSAEESDPAAQLLAAESSSDFLTAVLEYPVEGDAGAVP